jgi:hypothetical protein
MIHANGFSRDAETANLIIDGEEAPNTYDVLPFEARLVFDSPSELHTIAVRNGQVLLVTLQSER